jgi:hypothetical protein
MDTSTEYQKNFPMTKGSEERTGKGAIHNPVPRGPKGMQMEMRKFKQGKLHSGSPKGPIVKDRKQAIAIALNESGMSNK